MSCSRPLKLIQHRISDGASWVYLSNIYWNYFQVLAKVNSCVFPLKPSVSLNIYSWGRKTSKTVFHLICKDILLRYLSKEQRMPNTTNLSLENLMGQTKVRSYIKNKQEKKIFLYMYFVPLKPNTFIHVSTITTVCFLNIKGFC